MNARDMRAFQHVVEYMHNRRLTVMDELIQLDNELRIINKQLAEEIIAVPLEPYSID